MQRAEVGGQGERCQGNGVATDSELERTNPDFRVHLGTAGEIDAGGLKGPVGGVATAALKGRSSTTVLHNPARQTPLHNTALPQPEPVSKHRNPRRPTAGPRTGPDDFWLLRDVG